MKNLKYFLFNILTFIFTTNFVIYGLPRGADGTGFGGLRIYNPNVSIENNLMQIAFDIIFASIFLLFVVWCLIKSLNKTKKMPATQLLKFANLFPKKYRLNLVQEISDMRLEYCEALSEKKIWRARFIIVFYYIGLVWSVVMWISDKAKEVVGLLPKKN